MNIMSEIPKEIRLRVGGSPLFQQFCIPRKAHVNKLKKALVIVDVQPTFCEGGSLPVDGGNKVAKQIATFVSDDETYDCIITTQDWHIDLRNALF